MLTKDELLAKLKAGESIDQDAPMLGASDVDKRFKSADRLAIAFWPSDHNFGGSSSKDDGPKTTAQRQRPKDDGPKTTDQRQQTKDDRPRTTDQRQQTKNDRRKTTD